MPVPVVVLKNKSHTCQHTIHDHDVVLLGMFCMTIGDLDRPLPQDPVEIHHLYTIVHDTLYSTRCTVPSIVF
jgi:hypothetical protein